MAINLGLHVISITLWVGGMFFAYMILRPVAASELEPPVRLNLWRHVFNRFFPWVWGIIFIVPITGVLLVKNYGGFAHAPVFIHVMTTLGIIMIMIFLHVYFAPFKRLKRHLDANDIPAAAQQLNLIRKLVGANTLIGVITILVATAGRYLLH
jgi:uncharacterized membrane protein